VCYVTDMSIQVTTLANGFRVVTQTIPGAAYSALGLFTEAGSLDETAHNNGVAHFFEHMVFKGTRRRKTAQDIWTTIENEGGELNAGTSDDNTEYTAIVLKGDEAVAIDLIADMIQNSSFLRREIDRERKVILAELDESADDPSDWSYEQFLATAYPDQPLGRHTLGSKETLAAIGKPELLDFYHNHYTADRMIFSVAGPMPHEQVVDLVSAQFDRLNPAAPWIRERPVYKGGVSHIPADHDQTHVHIGYEGVPDGHYLQDAMGVLAVLTGQASSARLVQEIREKRGLAYSVYSKSLTMTDTGAFIISTAVSPRKVHGAVDCVAAEMQAMQTNITDAEIMRAKKILKADLVINQSGLLTRVRRNADNLVCGKPLSESIQPQLDPIDAVGRSAIEAAVRHLMASSPTLLVYGQAPRGMEARYDSAFSGTRP